MRTVAARLRVHITRSMSSSRGGTAYFQRQRQWRILFFGTDYFSLPHLVALNNERKRSEGSLIQLVDVVAPETKCPVREYAQAEGLCLRKWPLNCTTNKYDVGALASFGHIIPREVINMFPLGILNVHPSLLPKFRGAAPLHHTILHGDTVTGVSIMEIQADKVDAGPLIDQVTVTVPGNCATSQLRDRLADLGAYTLMNSLKKLPDVSRTPQRDEAYPYAHKLEPFHSCVNWQSQTVAHVDQQFRALAETFGLRTRLGMEYVSLKDMVPQSEMLSAGMVKAIQCHVATLIREVLPGTPIFLKKQGVLAIRCNGGWVGFRTVNINKSMSAKGFYGGYLQNKGEQRFESLENGLHFTSGRQSS